MNTSHLQNESLMEISTFLARRWSGIDNLIIEVSNKAETRTILNEGKIIIIPLEKLIGNDFQKYRQFRTRLWYESMRIKFCNKILSNDHAYGFILNSIETIRIEKLGRKIWRGMDNEIIFNYSYMFVSRPQLNTIYGRSRIVEAFYQYLMFETIKGYVQPSHFEKIKQATDIVKKTIDSIINDYYNGDITKLLEKTTSQIIKILEIDSLLTIPISLPFIKDKMPLSEKEMLKTIKTIIKDKKYFKNVDSKAITKGNEVYDEYKTLVDENQKIKNKKLGAETIGVQDPSIKNINENIIYDMNLINGLKMRFKEWKSGWKEYNVDSGDEFDEESYIDNSQPFLSDMKKSIKIKIVILLDHSSSIASNSLEYKKATLALCEVLSFLKVRFSVYAFSTMNRSIVCWSIKPDNAKWNNISAKRLAQIIANGSTPLAEVYDKMFPILQSKNPDILLTLTDGEPSDPDAVRTMIKSLNRLNIGMVAIGIGPNIIRATAIAKNLKQLGYEKAIAVSRLNDIPSKVIRILQI